MTGAEIAQWVVRVVLALVFVGMGVNHFRPGPARTMARIIPPSMRWEGILSPIRLVRFTGVCEIAGGIGILLPATRTAAAIGLVAFLIAVWPANAYAAAHPEWFGRVSIPFWPRYAGQLAVILLVVLAAV